MKRKVNPAADAIQRRFFKALDLLVSNGTIEGGITGFCARHDLSRVKYTNMRNQIDLSYEQKGNYKTIDIDALPALIVEGHVSPEWLLLGTGRMTKLPKERPGHED